MGLVKALEPPDETILYVSVFLAQTWGFIPSHYTFDFSTNLPFSPDMAGDYRELVRHRRLLEVPGPHSIRVHPECPPEEVAAVDERVRDLSGIDPPVRLALALLHYLAENGPRHSDLRDALRRWCLIPESTAEQAAELFAQREEVPVSSA